MGLTTKQRELIERAKDGKISLSDAQIVYASPIARKEALNRLELLGIIKQTNQVGVFQVETQNSESNIQK